MAEREVIFDIPFYVGRKLWCHLTANTVETLHQFARDIGLKPEWFQDKKGHPHYDICSSAKRKLALAYGAEQVTNRQYLLKVIEWHRKEEVIPDSDVPGIDGKSFKVKFDKNWKAPE